MGRVAESGIGDRCVLLQEHPELLSQFASTLVEPMRRKQGIQQDETWDSLRI